MEDKCTYDATQRKSPKRFFDHNARTIHIIRYERACMRNVEDNAHRKSKKMYVARENWIVFPENALRWALILR